MLNDDVSLIKKRFAKILEEDVKKVRKVIEKKHIEIYNDFKDANKSKRVTLINFNSFKALMKGKIL